MAHTFRNFNLFDIGRCLRPNNLMSLEIARAGSLEILKNNELKQKNLQIYLEENRSKLVM